LIFPRHRWDQDWYRLIPSRFPPVDVYEQFGAALSAIAPEIEALTNPRLAAKTRLTGGSASIDENSPRLQNWNHAPFAYTNPEGSYLLGPLHGVLEVAESEGAALTIAICRRETFLGRTNEPPLDLDMRLLSTRIAGDFVDLTDLALDTGQEARWEIGQCLLNAGEAGAVFRRAECPDALFLALFDAALLERSVQRTHYRFVWDGETIKSVYDFGTGQELKRRDLLPRDAAAAWVKYQPMASSRAIAPRLVTDPECPRIAEHRRRHRGSGVDPGVDHDPNQKGRGPGPRHIAMICFINLERVSGFEPPTPTLAKP
jgi:hypothetical protein